MKELFERYQKQRLEVEQFLEKSIELVREEKNPDAELCEKVGVALRDLRSVYAEIIDNLPGKAAGAIAPEGASVRELEALWQEANSERNSLKETLSEFIRVYSDEERYLEAIREQLDTAKDLLAQMEENEQARPDVGPYLTFLQCVKEDLDSNIALSNMLEDEGIEGFSNRALMGLQKKKYYIRDEESIEQSDGEGAVEESPRQTADGSAEESDTPAEETPAEEMTEAGESNPEEETEPGFLGYVDTAHGKVKVKIVRDTPASTAQPSKFTSRAKDRIGAMVFTLTVMMNMQLFPVDKVVAFNEGDDNGVLPQGDLDYLLSHGYLGIVSFTENGVEQQYYAPSSRAYECFRRSTVANYVKQHLGKRKNRFPKAVDLVHLKSWSAVFAYRCKVLIDYMLKRMDRYMIYIHRDDDLPDFPYCPHPDEEDNVVAHCTGILTEQDADTVVNFIVDYIRDYKDRLRLVIIVDSKEAIAAFNERTVGVEEEIRLDMDFVVADDPERHYDVSGALMLEMDDLDGVENIEDLKEIIGADNREKAEEEQAEAEQREEKSEEPETSGENEPEEDSDAGIGEPELAESVSPRKPLKAMKTPSRKEFEELEKKHFPVFDIICRNIGCQQVVSEEMLSRFVSGAIPAEHAAKVDVRSILDNLETKGYLASYEVEYKGADTVVYCHTDMLRSCLRKDNYRQLVTARENRKEVFPFATFVAAPEVSRQVLTGMLARAEAVNKIFEYQINMKSIIKTVFCMWNGEKGWHTGRITLVSRDEFNTVIVPHHAAEDPLVFPPESGDVLIVDTTGGLPAPEALPAGDGRRVFCINETWFYELTGGVWVKYGEEVLPEAEPAEPEPETGVVSEAQAPEPAEADPETPLPDAASDEDEFAASLKNLLNDAFQLFAKGRFYAGMTLLHGLEQEDETYRLFSERFGFALGDPYLEQDNRFANLQSVYKDPFGTDRKYDFLAYAAYLRMYCSPTAAYDPYSINEIGFLRDNIACACFKELNDTLNAIARYVGRYQHGLDDKTVESAVLKKTQLDRIPEYAAKAQNLLDARMYMPSTSLKRVNKMRLLLFSEGNDFANMLSVVAKDNRSELKAIKAFLQEKGIHGIVEDEAIDLVMDGAWDACGDKSTERFKGHQRMIMQRQLREIFECMKDWADDVEFGEKTKGSEAQDTLTLIRECKTYLEKAYQEIRKMPSVNLPAEEAAACAVLEQTVALTLDRLEGNITQERYRRNFYINLLKAPYVALDDERMPIIEGDGEQIKPLDFCNRVTLYLDDAVPKRSWRDVVKKIFTYSADRKCYNFGCAEVIRKYLNDIGQIGEFGDFNIQKAIASLSLPNKVNQSPNKWREDFSARFEMAKNDEWFDKDTIDRIDERIKAQREIYYNANNFGIYGQALQRMIAYFDETANRKKPLYQHRLNVLKERYEELEDKPIVRAIQTSIDKLRFGEAISFLDEADKGNFDIIESNEQPESKRFEEFLSRYASFYEDAKKESGLSLEKAFTQSHPTADTEDYRSAVTFLKNWPDRDKPTRAAVENILRNIGHEDTIKNVTDTEFGFNARFNEPLVDFFPHPIAEFGSVMYENGLQIAVIGNYPDLEDLFRNINITIRAMKVGIPVLLIVDTAIHLDVRRQLAGMFMTSLRIYTFIILDRVMALNIAEVRKASRWNTLLCCAVPFQPINPYSDNPNDEIPKEMFFGRISEINDIIHTKTAALVYGGRQLGKTALLHQARNLSRFPLQKKWASYVSIKDKKGNDAAKIIGDTLLNNPRESFFRKSDRKTWTWRILISTIRERLTYTSDCKDEFFLLIDEADAFLKSSAENEYAELQDLLQIVTDTNNRFRFVLAGLRDVVRFHRGIPNDLLAKFKKLPIKPLDFKDARQLLVKPLSYLGYTFSDAEGDVIAQILHSTNYFPGIIHFYAHKLIDKKHESFNSSTSPFYKLERNDLLLLLKDKKFLDLRKSRLEITLELDEKEDKYYNTLALLLSYYNYESVAERGKNYSQYGATPAALLECAKSIEKNAKISKLTEDQLVAVLEELCDLYILRPTPDDEGIIHYDFARTAFADMLGRKDEVQMKLINLMAEGGHDDD